jgi:hypothetical protein
MSKPYEWPKYEKHEHVRCFNCNAPIGANLTETHYDRAGGQYAKPCAKCAMRTYYDIAPIGNGK